MLHYLLQTIAFQLFFIVVYDLFLKRETFFNWNRAYLLVTVILSFILPFIKISGFKNAVAQEFVIALPEVFLGPKVNDVKELSPLILETETTQAISIFTWQNLFCLGVIVAFGLFLAKLFKVLQLIRNNSKIRYGKLNLVKLLKTTNAFSFFNYVFLGDELSERDKITILKHESVHVNHKHTIDLLFFELLRIAFWFNPLVYIYQNKITTVHEFTADSQAIKHQNKHDYYQNLLAQVFATKRISFINPFYNQSLIKKRIVMLQKSKSKQIYLFKYAILIPVVVGMLVYTSSSFKAENQSTINIHAQDVLLKSLIKEYKTKLVERIKTESIPELFKEYLGSNEVYILSKADLAKRLALYDYIGSGKFKSQKQSVNDIISDSAVNEFPKLYKTYQEYLDYKKTDEAKKRWENGTRNGVLRLLVNDVKNLTTSEQQREEKLINTIKNDDYFNALLITDGTMSTKLTFNKPVIDVEEVEVVENTTIDVPFSVIDEVPVFPGCQDLQTVEEKRSCMSKKISEHVNKNFNTNMADSLGLTGRQRINVIFKIDTHGNVIAVRSRAPHPALEAEAKRVVKTLPKMVPGKHKGKSVNVPYSLPIIFQVADKVNKEMIEVVKTENTEDMVDVPFSVIEKVPVFPGCENLKTNTDLRKCFSEQVSAFVADNFNTKIASSKGLTGRQRINVIFKINKNGNVIGVRSRASHPDLEAEAKRVVNSLPKMIPGEEKGKKVNVAYALPIIFNVSDQNKDE
ncbi:energy transducer TonB [Neotamlana laminarinivorans]|uniref:Energy transducer TonB n=1 Tax=Neotamlana laminarinivorans TaxID=2883124 RepID=A0A9X1I0W8_9FLAO|nr:energy transducer TonB [Tamlana laminarinivorans]MCB4799763.1 energy transducer TonB [Tamlana laminarinivorans]